MGITQESINNLYAEIRKQAMVDEEFRKELLASPNAVIERMLGQKLPEGMNIAVIENDPAYDATFVLPDLMGEEIEDAELDSVAGGVSVVIGVSACAVAIGIGPCNIDACAANATAVNK